jgi:hypothetical protein
MYELLHVEAHVSRHQMLCIGPVTPRKIGPFYDIDDHFYAI